MIGLKVLRVKDGQERQSFMEDRRKRLGRLRMKHISWHKEGYQIRISFNGKIHVAWKAFRHFESEFECLEAAIQKRNEILDKLKKPLSGDPVPMGSIAFLNKRSNSNTGFRGLYYREYSYQKRGVKQFTKVVDVRWWNNALGEFGHTTVAVKKQGGKAQAIRVARRLQKELEGKGDKYGCPKM